MIIVTMFYEREIESAKKRYHHSPKPPNTVEQQCLFLSCFFSLFVQYVCLSAVITTTEHGFFKLGCHVPLNIRTLQDSLHFSLKNDLYNPSQQFIFFNGFPLMGFGCEPVTSIFCLTLPFSLSSQGDPFQNKKSPKYISIFIV